jgi:hypothetical protein
LKLLFSSLLDMGYDMYRVTGAPDLTQENPELNVAEGEDTYFRLNIWGMSKAKILAAWGISRLTVDDLIYHHGKLDENKKDGTDSLRAMMDTTAAFGQKCIKSNEKGITELFDSVTNFSSNYNYAPTEECVFFAEALGKAFSKLDAALILPAYDYEYYREFMEWLIGSPDGVFVG